MENYCYVKEDCFCIDAWNRSKKVEPEWLRGEFRGWDNARIFYIFQESTNLFQSFTQVKT